jgi:hypothetical protein
MQKYGCGTQLFSQSLPLESLQDSQHELQPKKKNTLNIGFLYIQHQKVCGAQHLATILTW